MPAASNAPWGRRPARSLAGIRALVTGASSGIGASLSRMLVDRGAQVVGTGRDEAALRRVPFAGVLARDLCLGGAPEDVVEEAVALLGGLDLVVSNAGAGWAGPLETMPAVEVDRALDINLRAPLHLARAAAPHLLNSPAGGQLVLVGSIAGLLGVAEEAAYAAAKAGLRGLAESLRAEWSSRSALAAHPGARPVTVTLVSPGPVDTAFFTRRNQPYLRSWPRPVAVEKVAQRILAAIERRAPDVIVPSWLSVPARLNGGLPGLFRLLSKAQDHLPG